MEPARKAMWRSEERRSRLTELLPLKTPLTVNIEVSSGCNLKCCYCLQSLPAEQKARQNFHPQLMRLDTFKSAVDGCRGFKDRIKVLRISGLGEPLLNPQLESMIQYARESGCFEKLMLFTNGVLLTAKRSDGILKAGGIDTLLFDVQGLNSEDYLRYCGSHIEFPQLLENIKYYHQRKNSAEIFVKIYRYAVKGREREFFDLFSPIADYVSIDNIYEAFKHVDYRGLITSEDVDGRSVGYKTSRYCPYPFFQLTVDADGTVEACCSTQERSVSTLFIGDVKENSLTDIWNGKRLQRIRRDMLSDGNSYDTCRGCKMLEHLPETDVIDGALTELGRIYGKEND